MAYSNRHHHGNIPLGRTMVAIAAFFVLAIDWIIYRQATVTPFPIPGLQVTLVISVVWFVAGSIALALRHGWGRAMVLTILFAGAGGFFVTGIVTIAAANGQLAGQLKTLVAATIIYLVAGLFLANSKHVRRLTSRAWE